MKKRGVSTPVLISLAVLILALVGLTYYYTTKEKVVLTSEEQKTAQSLDLTPKEFKEISTKTKEIFEINESELFFEEGEEILEYSKIESIEKIQRYHNIGYAKIKPGSKIIRVSPTFIQPPPYIVYLIEDGKITVLVEELQPGS